MNLVNSTHSAKLSKRHCQDQGCWSNRGLLLRGGNSNFCVSKDVFYAHRGIIRYTEASKKRCERRTTHGIILISGKLHLTYDDINNRQASGEIPSTWKDGVSWVQDFWHKSHKLLISLNQLVRILLHITQYLWGCYVRNIIICSNANHQSNQDWCRGFSVPSALICSAIILSLQWSEPALALSRWMWPAHKPVHSSLCGNPTHNCPIRMHYESGFMNNWWENTVRLNLQED